jgi:hypothetical protein
MARFLLLSTFAIIMSCGGSSAADTDGLLKDLKAKDAKVRLKAAESLATAEGGNVAAGLCEAVLDSNAKVSTAALRSLEKVAPDLSKHMATYAVDRIKGNRIAAIEEIGKLGDKGKPAVRALASILLTVAPNINKDQDSRSLAHYAAQSIRKLGVADDDVAESLMVLARGSASQSVRLNVIMALADWAGTGDEQAMAYYSAAKKWLSSAQWSQDADALKFVCKSLANYGGDAKKEFGPALEKLKLSPTLEVREIAAKTLAGLEK